MLDIHALPNDVEGLKRLVIEREGALQAQLREKQQQIEHLKFQLAQLRRARFGQSSEALESIGQLPLSFEELQAAVAEAVREAQDLSEGQAPAQKGQPVRRKQLPEHFERIAQQAMGTPWVPRNPRKIDGPAEGREILELAA